MGQRSALMTADNYHADIGALGLFEDLADSAAAADKHLELLLWMQLLQKCMDFLQG